VLAALLVTMATDEPAAYSLELPTWLAARLSESGDRDLVITRPPALWLTPLALAPYLAAVALRSLVDVRGVQVAAQLFARLLLLMAIALALAMPTLRSPLRGKTIVFVVDVSRSIDDGQLAAAGAILEEAASAAQAERGRLPAEDAPRLRLVTYAEQARVGEAERLPTLERHTAADLASDHAGALRLAEAMIDPDTEGRVVVITEQLPAGGNRRRPRRGGAPSGGAPCRADLRRRSRPGRDLVGTDSSGAGP
jgi:hypothetical protein